MSIITTSQSSLTLVGTLVCSTSLVTVPIVLSIPGTPDGGQLGSCPVPVGVTLTYAIIQSSSESSPYEFDIECNATGGVSIIPAGTFTSDTGVIVIPIKNKYIPAGNTFSVEVVDQANNATSIMMNFYGFFD